MHLKTHMKKITHKKKKRKSKASNDVHILTIVKHVSVGKGIPKSFNNSTHIQ